ncbi:MAG: flagellar hook-length control protein FliK [Lachnospiraceae bacterium]
MQISELLQQYQNQFMNTPQLQAVLAKGTASSELLESLMSLGHLKIGDVFEGSVIKSSKEMYTISLANGKQIEARLDFKSNTAFSLFDEQLQESPEAKSIFFQIKSVDGGVLQLKPLLSHLGTNPQISHALEAAGLPVTERTVAMVQNRMDFSLPIDVSALKEMNRVLNLNPEVSASTAAAMEKAGVPISISMASVFENYQMDTHRIVTQIDLLLTQIVSDAETETNSARQIVTVDASGPLQVKGSEPQDNKVIPQSTEMTPMANLTVSGEKMELAAAVLDKLPRPIREALQQEPERVKNLLSQEWLLRPEDFSKEEISKLYERLLEQTEAVKQILTATGKDTQLLDNLTSNIKQNVDFMQQIQQLYPYIQVPLRMNGHHTSAELFVYTNKNQGTDKEGELSAFLHLDLDSLGSTDVSVHLKDMQINTKFYVDRESSADLISKNLYRLTDRLEEKGYQTQVTVTMDETQPTIPSRMFGEPVDTSAILHRYSFDALA